MNRIEYMEHFKRVYNKEKEVVKNASDHKKRIQREAIEAHQERMRDNEASRI